MSKFGSIFIWLLIAIAIYSHPANNTFTRYEQNYYNLVDRN